MREGDGGGLTFSFKVGLAALALFLGNAGVRYAGAGARRVTDVDVVVEVVTTVVWAMGVAVATSFLQRGSPRRQRRVRAYVVATTFYALPELPRNVATIYLSPRILGREWAASLSIATLVITVVAIVFLAFVPWSAFSGDGDALRAGVARARGYRGRLSLIVLVTMIAQVMPTISYRLWFGWDNSTVPQLIWVLSQLAFLLLVRRLWYESEPDEAFSASEVSE